MDLPDLDATEWSFLYIAYSFAEKTVKATVIQKKVSYEATTEADHIIPAYVGIYLAPEVMGKVTDPTVCISSPGSMNECYVDDVECLANNCNVIIDEGEIPYDGPNP